MPTPSTPEQRQAQNRRAYLKLKALGSSSASDPKRSDYKLRGRKLPGWQGKWLSTHVKQDIFPNFDEALAFCVMTTAQLNPDLLKQSPTLRQFQLRLSIEQMKRQERDAHLDCRDIIRQVKALLSNHRRQEAREYYRDKIQRIEELRRDQVWYQVIYDKLARTYPQYHNPKSPDYAFSASPVVRLRIAVPERRYSLAFADAVDDDDEG